jgi:DNA-binding transcriptional MerR regulator
MDNRKLPERLTAPQAARRVGLAASTLRKLDRRGIYKARRDWRGHLFYGEADIVRLRKLAAFPPELAD